MFGIPLLPAAFFLGRRSLLRRGVKIEKTYINGYEVSYFDAPGKGKGLPVLLVHGLAGSSMSWSRCLLELLEHSSRVVAFDLPGAGLSPAPATGPLRFWEAVELSVAFASRVMPPSFLLSGASMGAALAVRVALKMPQQVKGLALIVPAGARVPPSRVEEQLQRLQARDKREAQALVGRLFAKPSRILSWALADDALRLYNQPWVLSILQEAAEGADTMTLQEEELASLSMPVKVLWAKGERLVLEDGIEYFRKNLPPHAEIEEIEHVGHTAHIERPALIAERIASLMRRHLHSQE